MADGTTHESVGKVLQFTSESSVVAPIVPVPNILNAAVRRTARNGMAFIGPADPNRLDALEADNQDRLAAEGYIRRKVSRRLGKIINIRSED